MKKRSGTSYFKDLSRKGHVELVSRIIKEEGVGAASIRRMASELGCSSASMHRYLDNLDGLLLHVQLDALNECTLGFSIREKEWKDMWDVHFGIRRSYAMEAFRNPEAFEPMFRQNINRDLGEVLKEYYEVFPDAIIWVSPLVKEMSEIPGYYDRDYFICKHLAAEGKITEGNAGKLNHILCALFLGYFKFTQEHGVELEEIPEPVERFISESKEIIRLCASDLVPQQFQW